MNVTLKIYSGLKKYVKNYNKESGIILKIDEGVTVKQFLEKNIDHDRAIDAISMVTVNEKIVAYNNYNKKLKDGDLIKVFPPIGGG